MRQNNRVGHLPQDWPGVRRAISLGLQIFVAIFAATVFVPTVTGFNVSATLFTSGLATLVALGINRFRIPLYYGASFSAILAVQAIVAANGGGEIGIRVAQAGIVAAAVVQILVGFAVMKMGPKIVDKVLPPIVTGPVAMIIAFGLSGAAIDMASGICCLRNSQGLPVGSLIWWTIAAITCLATIFWSHYLQGRGLLGMLPILGGAFVGYFIAIPLGLVNWTGLGSAQLLRFPHLTLPAFDHPGAPAAVLTIAVVVIATIPESVAHLYQISLVVKKIAGGVGREQEASDLNELVGLNLVSDGSGDLVTGGLGGSMGTNYGEAIAAILLAGAATVYAVIAAGVFAIVSSTSGHLEAFITSVPTAVVGGLSLYLFASFGMVGFKMLMSVGAEEILKPKNLAIAGLILLLGIGGGNKFGGALPIPLSGQLANLLPGGVPAIAAAAFVGIALNLVFTLVPGREMSEMKK